jgi:Regulator of chromosome condensation (RCC1) repeat/Bacterial Ig domain
MKKGFGSFVLLSLVVLNAAAVVQDQVQDSFGSWADLRPGGRKLELAQTFQPAIAGRLVSIQHSGVSPSGVAEYPTTFTIVDTVNGQPGTNILGQTVITNISAQTTVYFTNQSVFLETNATYAIVLSTEAPLTTSRKYSFRTSLGDAYLRGALWSRPFGDSWSPAYAWDDPAYPMDLAFATYMDPGIPAVRIVKPTDAANLNVGEPVEVGAAVWSQITNAGAVTFYAGSVVIGSDISAPYSANWIPEVAGLVDLVAVIETAEGARMTSGVCQVTVNLSGPVNDDFDNRTILAGEVHILPINQSNATVEVGEPRSFPQSAGKSVWWQWTPPRKAWASVVVTPAPQTNALLSLFTGSQVGALFLLTNRAGFLVNPVQAGTAYQIAVDSLSNELVGDSLVVALNDIEITNPSPNTVFHAPANFTIRAQRTADVRELATIVAFANSLPIGQMPLATYELPCSLPDSGYYNLHLAATDAQGILTRSEDVPIIVRPTNDDFENSQILYGRTAEIHTSNLAATMQVTGGIFPWEPKVGEPTWFDNQGGHSIWYQWTAPADGMCVIDGHGTNFALLFYVCLGTTVNSLSVVAANALGAPYGAAQFDAVAGTTYFISVDGYYGEEGSLDWTLHLKPYNDDFASRRLLSGLDSEFLDSNSGATTESGESNVLPSGAGTSLWYSWQSPLSGTVSVAVTGTNSMALAVFKGDSLSNLALVAQIPGGWTNSPSATFEAQSGETYQIGVFGEGDAAGFFMFHLAWQGLRLVSPLPNTIWPAPATLHLAAQLDLPGKSLKEILFKANDRVIGSVTNPPFAFDWSVPMAGTYTLSVQGLASDDTSYRSVPLTCLVYSETQLPRPRVFSGVYSDASYVINAVGALHLFGANPNQFGRTATNLPSTPFLASWPEGVRGWKEISSSWTSGSWAISDSGKLYQDGQTLIPFPAGVNEWKHVSCGVGGVVTVGDEGNLYIGGTSQFNVPQPPGGWRDARASLTGAVSDVMLGLGEDGEAYLISYVNWQWDVQLLPRPAGVTGWKAIAQAGLFGVLLTEDDNLWIYGFYGDVTGTSGTPGYSLVPRPAGVNRWVDFAAGGYHVLAIGDNGQLYAWGRNWEHQLGIGMDQNSRATPVRVDPPPGVGGWSAVAAGQFHSLAIGHDCSLYAWGANDSGQLGQPASVPFSRPMRVASLEALCGTPVLFVDGNASRLPDGTFRLRFNTDLNRSYLIQYSDDVKVWKSASPAVTGTGELVEWIDDGPPKTEVHPASVSCRVYRVVYAP